MSEPELDLVVGAIKKGMAPSRDDVLRLIARLEDLQVVNTMAYEAGVVTGKELAARYVDDFATATEQATGQSQKLFRNMAESIRSLS